MKEVHKSAIEKSIVWLKAAGCTFAIIDADGNKYGDLEVAEKKKKRPGLYPHGELSKYVGAFLKNIKPSEVVDVPLGKYDRKTIMSTCSSWMCRNVGNGVHTAAFNEKTNAIEVLRVS